MCPRVPTGARVSARVYTGDVSGGCGGREPAEIGTRVAEFAVRCAAGPRRAEGYLAVR
ncbi:hypothetical protein SAMN05216267_106023 [Actinacidiphila rubida]|uniref:Uncharacterized protein n=1 Tax=Actinacidiphila rubida TaxID=310780 RepID=A0A1H8TYG9_9ACTN|nr:hypothetical protein SAMN05216267_106023 [Actinacidiphila rubida]